MKLYLMTDLEGVAGVINCRDWCMKDSMYYEQAKEFLTHEINAAVAGFFEGGADEIVVADGHGAGAVNIKLLDSRAKLMRGWFPPVYPFLLNDSYDAIAWVGQHAKSGSKYAHLPHTNSAHILEFRINDVSVGELGEMAFCASELAVPSIFASGDMALCRFAQGLIPGIETVTVKEGTRPGTGNDWPVENYMEYASAALHLHPQEACKRIREGALKAMRKVLSLKDKPDYGRVPLQRPFKRTKILRQTKDKPRMISVETHPDSVIALMNMPYSPKLLSMSDDPAAREFSKCE